MSNEWLALVVARQNDERRAGVRISAAQSK